MEQIRNQEYGGERPLFATHDLQLEDVTIHAGESALKECSNIIAINCRFEGKYPFWHTNGFIVMFLFSIRTLAPSTLRILRLTATSLMSGRFSMTQTSAAKIVAGRMPTAAFFAPEMMTSPCRGLPPVITNFSNFMISLSQSRSPQAQKVSSRYVIPSRCTKLTTSWHNYSYFIIHNFQQKAKPQCTLVDYFLFCPVSFLLFSDFVSYFQENFTFATAYHTLSSQRVSLIQPS